MVHPLVTQNKYGAEQRRRCRIRKFIVFCFLAWEKQWWKTVIRTDSKDAEIFGDAGKGKVCCFLPWGRKRERDVWSARCRLTTGLVRLPTPSLLCMPSPPPSYLDLLLLCSVPRKSVRLLPLRSRCTVAFGLCIIITITASSSWLVAEKPPRVLSRSPRSHPRPLFSDSFVVVRVSRGERWKRGGHGRLSARVCALIKFLEGYTRNYHPDPSSATFCTRLIAYFDGLSANQRLPLHVIGCVVEWITTNHVTQERVNDTVVNANDPPSV